MFSVACVCHSVERRVLPLQGPGNPASHHAETPPPNPFQYVVHTVGKLAVGIQLRCLLVILAFGLFVGALRIRIQSKLITIK